jgi:hypothetical protein
MFDQSFIKKTFDIRFITKAALPNFLGLLRHWREQNEFYLGINSILDKRLLNPSWNICVVKLN